MNPKCHLKKKKSIDFWLDQENVGMKTCRIGSASSMRGKKKQQSSLKTCRRQSYMENHSHQQLT